MTKELLYDLDNLRHMLGIKQSRGRRDWGFRNYFNSTESGPDYESMKRLETMGFVVQGRRCYWHATEAGCKAVGMNDKEIKRALHDE